MRTHSGPRRASPASPQPALFNRTPMDLLKLFRTVMRAGGYKGVMRDKGWVSSAGRNDDLPRACHAGRLCRLQARVGRSFNPPPSMTDLSYQVKRIYTTKLLDFEQVGGTAEQQRALWGRAAMQGIHQAEGSRGKAQPVLAQAPATMPHALHIALLPPLGARPTLQARSTPSCRWM